MVESDNRRKKFYVDYGLNPAYIGALTTALIAVLVWGAGVSRDQATTNAVLSSHAEDDKKIEKRVDKLETQTDDRLARMEAKLDRLIDRSKR